MRVRVGRLFVLSLSYGTLWVAERTRAVSSALAITCMQRHEHRSPMCAKLVADCKIHICKIHICKIHICKARGHFVRQEEGMTSCCCFYLFAGSRLEVITWSIFAKKLYPIFFTRLVWAPQWQHKRVLFRSENMAVVQAIQSSWCREAVAIQMLRVMTMVWAGAGCCRGAGHIPGTTDDHADALSWLQVTRCRRFHPLSLTQPTPIPASRPSLGAAVP